MLNSKRFLRICSIFLTLVLVFQMLPHQALATTLEDDSTVEHVVSTQKDTLDTSSLDVVEEVTGKRTEFSKEFRMSNGLHLSAVYGTAVHFEENGQWKEIDNTLRPVVSTTGNFYANTAGVWNIALPETLSSQNEITVSKDGYTLGFVLAGSLTNTGSGTEVMGTDGNETLSLSPMNEALGTVQDTGAAKALASVEHPETVVTKAASRLQYSDVYPGTHVVYDLQSNELKESIIMARYDSALRGYRYTLNVGTLIPVLQEDQSIWFYDENRENVVLYMPAPYLLDAQYNYSGDVEVQLQGSGSSYTLTYLLPHQWMAAEDRAWPVVLDPVIAADVHVDNIRDITVGPEQSDGDLSPILTTGYRQYYGAQRFFLKYWELPALTSSDVIVSASIQLYKPYDTSGSINEVEVHKVQGTWESETITWANMPALDPNVEDFVMSGEDQWYTWDVTDIVRGWYSGDNTGMAFKGADSIENAGVRNIEEFYSSDYSSLYRPTLAIYFRNNNGLESYWDYLSASAGRAGTGYVNQYTGNLIWVRSDMGFGGNRMPVSISHVYNANDSQNNTFGMGYGWRINFNQRVYVWSENSNYYVWEDSDGTKHYFYYESSNTYKDEDGLELTLTTSGSGDTKYCIQDKYGNASYFDTNGRLRKQENNQATKSSITVAYTTTSGYLIDYVTDGVGRKYDFTYSGNLLSRIAYLGTGTSEVTYMTFGYSSSKLTTITDKDGKAATYGYSGYLLTSATDVDGYKLAYTYTAPAASWQPYRVLTVAETDGSAQGGTISIQYDHNQTTFTDHKGRKQIVQFNNWGNTVSMQDGEGRAQFAQYATDSDQDNGKGNQLTVASKLQNTVGNMLSDSSFELSTAWSTVNSNVTRAVSTAAAYRGNRSLSMTRSSAGTASGVQTEFTAENEKTYTFSAWVKTGAGAAYLAIYDGSSTVTSETLAANSGWTRLQVSYTNTSGSAKTVYPRFMTAAAGTAYMDCVQVELAPTASRFNLIENGDFRFITGWDNSAGRTTVTAAAPQLSTNVYDLTGNFNSTNRISQTVQVSGSAGETFILGGWAKGNAAPGSTNEDRKFALLAAFNYTDGTTSDPFTVSFNPDVENWQYAAAPIVAGKAYSGITVYLAYDYNANTVSFDGIQLYKEEFGSSYTYDDDGNIISVKDVQSQITSYEYTSNNLTKTTLPTGAKLTYTYDNYHNVKTATSQTGVAYSFAYDTYGNNTQVSITSGGVTLSSRATYTDTGEEATSGNTLATATDAAGNVTTYQYNATTNVLEWVKYPKDTDSSKTTYSYDNMYRLANTNANTGSATLSASYTYTDDLLTKVQTGSTTYSFTYGNFGLRSNIKIGSRTLATYSYTEKDNFLEKLDYGNGDKVEYDYDNMGRILSETYEDGDEITYQYDNDGALATVTDSAGNKTTYYYDFTNRLMKYVESGNNHNHTVSYEYDDINNLTRLVQTIQGTQTTTSYTYDLDNRVTAVTGDSASRSYTYDGFSRISQRVTRHSGTTVLTDTLAYRTVNGAATGQIATLTSTASGYSASYTYTYDTNGNITAITSGGKTTGYVYDSANQLIRENNQAANKTWVWTYDDAGNITSRKEYAYTTGTLGSVQDTVTYGYGDTSWGDLLTSYDGKAITYDQIGNPLSDGVWNYTWEHGRQLASMTSGGTTWSYDYDANGMRTKRTNGSTTYEYFYTGDKLTYMTVNGTGIWFYYDASGTPYALYYGGQYYYYATNAQGDVTAILNTSGSAVVTYTYDAWGNPLEITGTHALANLNSLRYRGYVYDNETELYYLQSRYYNPEVGRFLNADAFTSTGQGLLGHNMYIYCNNNPTTLKDSNGNFGILASMALGAIFGAVSQAVSGIVSNVLEGKTGEDLFSDLATPGEYVAAAVSGAITAIPGAGLAVSIVCDIAAPAVQQCVDVLLGESDGWNTEKYREDVVSNVASDLLWGKLEVNSPSFIRDIKDEAINMGIKGTKALNSYLKKVQNNVFLINQSIGVLCSAADEVYYTAYDRATR